MSTVIEPGHVIKALGYDSSRGTRIRVFCICGGPVVCANSLVGPAHIDANDARLWRDRCAVVAEQRVNEADLAAARPAAFRAGWQNYGLVMAKQRQRGRRG